MPDMRDVQFPDIRRFTWVKEFGGQMAQLQGICGGEKQWDNEKQVV